jgi:acetylornithine/succinyldiaminopimelate/putrescine aminotransferase
VVRGAGAWPGWNSARRIDVNAALERGLLVNRTANTVIRLLPPYVITEAHVDEAVKILEEILN